MNESVSTAPQELSETTSEQTNMQIAFAAVLAARKRTFLARYSRKLKFSVSFCFLALALTPVFLSVFSGHEKEAAAPSVSQETHQDKPADAMPSRPAIAVTQEPILPKTEAEKRAASINDETEQTITLEAAPDFALVEETSAGRLPKISADGRKPWQVYARPFQFQDPRPRIAIVMTDMGLSRVATDAALRRLPSNISMAFDAQAPSVDSWLYRARQDGHETLVAVPMEPFDYPRNDPGPNSLLTNLPNADNIQRLQTALASGVGYVGLTTISGSRFLSDPAKLKPVMEILQKRGLLFVDTRIATHSAAPSLGQELHVPIATSSREIDVEPTPAAIDEALLQLEQTARLEGAAIGVATPLPVTMDRLELWSKTLAQRGIVLSPISAVAQ